MAKPRPRIQTRQQGRTNAKWRECRKGRINGFDDSYDTKLMTPAAGVLKTRGEDMLCDDQRKVPGFLGFGTPELSPM